MPDRQIPDIPTYKGGDKHLSDIFDRLQRAVDHLVNTDFVTEKDIYCRDLITSAASIYIGEKSPKCKIDIVEGNLRFAQQKVSTDSDTRKIIKDQAETIQRLESKIDELEKSMETVKSQVNIKEV